MTYSDDIIKNTLVDYPRLDKLVELASKAPKGYWAEVGVYKGGTAKLLAKMVPPSSQLFLFDTFQGMPPADSYKDRHKEGDFNDTSLCRVQSLLLKNACFQNFSLYKGIFPRENSEYIEQLSFAFVHLDVDIYTSVKECLEFFLPRMVPGGVIVLDDYNEPNCPGAKLATDEFCAANNLVLEPTVQSQAIIRIKE